MTNRSAGGPPEGGAPGRRWGPERATKREGFTMQPPDGLRAELRPLCAGSFPGLGFTHKMKVLDALRGLLESEARQGRNPRETGPGVRAHPCQRGACLQESLFAAGPAASFPRCLAPVLLETVRNDPFPRVRRAAVRAMIRIEPPVLPGAGIEDYLPGLLGRDAVSTCAVALFIVRLFGPASVMRVVDYMNAQGVGLPPALGRLLEGVCEEEMDGMDPLRARMLLRGRCQGERAGREGTPAIEPEAAARARFERVRGRLARPARPAGPAGRRREPSNHP